MKKDKRGKEKRERKAIAIAEIFLIISFTFVIAVLMSESVSASEVPITVGNAPPIYTDTSNLVKLNPNTFTSAAPVATQAAPATVSLNYPGLEPQLGATPVQPGGIVSTNTPAAASADNPIFAGRVGYDAPIGPGIPPGTQIGSTLPKGVPTPADSFIGRLFQGNVFYTKSTGNYFMGAGGKAAGSVVAGLAWATTAYLAVTLISSFIGLNKGTTKALQNAVLGGGFVAGTLQGFGNTQLWTSFLTTGAGPLVAGGVIAVAIFVATYKAVRTETLYYQCQPYEPPLGGAKCEQCNSDPFRPCTEYRCKSLGQACQLLNPGTGQEKCTWVNPHDVNAPTITPWTNVLSPSKLSYNPDNAVNPPDRGVKIVDSSDPQGCLQAFTPLTFGITNNEPARCKIDWNRPNGTGQAAFDSMQFDFGGLNYFDYNHTQTMALPSPNSSGTDLSPVLQNNGLFGLYVKCMDANGNVNENNFVFEFCVNAGPDTTPPVIVGSSIDTGSPVQYNADKVPIELYVNEPSECKWSRIDTDYSSMENSMNCATQSNQINAQLTYTCSANLTGIKNQEDNTFYFRCKDQPDKPESERNVMQQSYPLTLKGTQPLNILTVGPNGTIFGNTDVVTVTLSATTGDGANDGTAACYFSPTGQNGSYVEMFNTNNYLSTQDLDLTSGNYSYNIRCIDAAGNAAEAVASFNVFVDRTPPTVTRVYRETDALKVVTNENAQCSYSTNSCDFNFADGIKMQYSNPNIRNVNFAQWKTNSIYYIKCTDDYNNQVNPNACSIVVNTVNLVGTNSTG